jgi:hypothetical protein
MEDVDANGMWLLPLKVHNLVFGGRRTSRREWRKEKVMGENRIEAYYYIYA